MPGRRKSCDTSQWIARNIEAARLVPVAGTGFGVEGRLHRPIVRQVELAPPAVFEGRSGRTVGIASLGHIGEFAGAVGKITGLVKRMPEGETPAGVHQQTLARRNRDRIMAAKADAAKTTARKKERMIGFMG